MNLLVIEDEVKTGAYLRKGLEESGFQVELAADGLEGLRLAAAGRHTLIILDVMLPYCDGWSILARLREAGRHTPVLILTARDAVADRVKGLDLGADDYLVKPFAFSELLARIRSLLRRGQPPREETLQIADLVLDHMRRKVRRAGKPIRLTAKEFSLLTMLAQHAGEVQSRTLIAEQVWGMNFDSATNVVDVAIRRLRSKIDEPFETKLIHSVRGVGYVLEG